MSRKLNGSISKNALDFIVEFTTIVHKEWDPKIESKEWKLQWTLDDVKKANADEIELAKIVSITREMNEAQQLRSIEDRVHIYHIYTPLYETSGYFDPNYIDELLRMLEQEHRLPYDKYKELHDRTYEICIGA